MDTSHSLRIPLHVSMYGTNVGKGFPRISNAYEHLINSTGQNKVS